MKFTHFTLCANAIVPSLALLTLASLSSHANKNFATATAKTKSKRGFIAKILKRIAVIHKMLLNELATMWQEGQECEVFINYLR